MFPRSDIPNFIAKVYHRQFRYLFIAVLLAPTGIVHAHPLGIFSVNRYTRIDLAGEAIRLVYVMDVAEIPSIQEFTKIDRNGDGNVDDQERNRYAEETTARIADEFRLTVDGGEAAVRPTHYEVSFPEGQGGLKTIRLVSTFETSLPSNAQTHDIAFIDHNFD